MTLEIACHILGLKENWTKEDVKTRFSLLSKAYHPEEYPQEYEQLVTAYRIVSAHVRKAEQSKRQHVPPGGQQAPYTRNDPPAYRNVPCGDNPFAQADIPFGNDPFAQEDASLRDNPFAQTDIPPRNNPFTQEDASHRNNPFAQADAPHRDNPFAQADAPHRDNPFAQADAPPRDNPFAQADASHRDNPFAQADAPPGSNPFTQTTNEREDRYGSAKHVDLSKGAKVQGKKKYGFLAGVPVLGILLRTAYRSARTSALDQAGTQDTFLLLSIAILLFAGLYRLTRPVRFRSGRLLVSTAVSFLFWFGASIYFWGYRSDTDFGDLLNDIVFAGLMLSLIGSIILLICFVIVVTKNRASRYR